MNKSKQIKIGSILGYLYTGLQSIVSLIYIPILLKGIGQNEYGLYQIVGSIISYFSVMESPLSASILRYYSAYKAENNHRKMENTLAIGRRIFWIISGLIIIMAIPCIFIIRAIYSASLSSWEITEATWMFIIMITNSVIEMNNFVYVAAITANESFVFLKLSSILLLCVQPISVICLIYRYPYALSIIIIQLVLNILLIAVRRYYCLCHLKVKIIYHGKDKSLVKALLSLSVSVLVVVIADQIFWQTDQLVLGAMTGTGIVAVYSIGSQLNSMFINVGCVLGGMIMPLTTRILKQDNSKTSMSELFAKVGRYQSYIVCLILSGVILFGREFILLLAGEKFSQSYYVAILLMIPYSIDLIQTCGGTILQVKDKYFLRSWVMIFVAIINVILTIVFTKLFGMVGAAAATTITIVIGSGFMMNYVYAKIIHLNIKLFFRRVFPIWSIAIGAAIFSIPINLIKINNAYFQFGFHVILYCILYGIAMSVFALNREEKVILLSHIKKGKH